MNIFFKFTYTNNTLVLTFSLEDALKQILNKIMVKIYGENLDTNIAWYQGCTMQLHMKKKSFNAPVTFNKINSNKYNVSAPQVEWNWSKFQSQVFLHFNTSYFSEAITKIITRLIVINNVPSCCWKILVSIHCVGLVWLTSKLVTTCLVRAI